MKLPVWLTRIRNKLVHLVAYLVMWLVRVLPEEHGYRVGEHLALLVYSLQPNWQATALRNLELLYKNSPPSLKPVREELLILARDSAVHLGWEVIEFMRMGLGDRERGLDMVVSREGEEHLLRGLEEGKGIILIGLHFGNWELTGAHIASRLAPMYAVGKQQRDSFFTDLAFPWRAKYGMRNIAAGRQQGSAILRALKENAVLGLVSDQNGGKHGTFADFCGITASCVTGAAQLVVKTGAPCVAAYAMRLEPGRLSWYCTPPLDQSGLSENPLEAVPQMLERINQCIEGIVKRAPSQWLLGHKRWKTRPPGFPSLYQAAGMPARSVRASALASREGSPGG